MTDSFVMTAAHLARSMESARARERAKIAEYLEGRAGSSTGEGALAVGEAFLEAAEYVRSLSAGVKPARVAVVDPLLRDIDAEVANEEANLLPPVRHHDDVAEGEALVRSLGARGKLNLPRD